MCSSGETLFARVYLVGHLSCRRAVCKIFCTHVSGKILYTHIYGKKLMLSFCSLQESSCIFPDTTSKSLFVIETTEWKVSESWIGVQRCRCVIGGKRRSCFIGPINREVSGSLIGSHRCRCVIGGKRRRWVFNDDSTDSPSYKSCEHHSHDVKYKLVCDLLTRDCGRQSQYSNGNVFLQRNGHEKLLRSVHFGGPNSKRCTFMKWWAVSGCKSIARSFQSASACVFAHDEDIIASSISEHSTNSTRGPFFICHRYCPGVCARSTNHIRTKCLFLVPSSFQASLGKPRTAQEAWEKHMRWRASAHPCFRCTSFVSCAWCSTRHAPTFFWGSAQPCLVLTLLRSNVFDWLRCLCWWVALLVAHQCPWFTWVSVLVGSVFWCTV